MSITRLLIVALLWGASLGLAAGERINLNVADAETLAANIVGIGPARAAAIVEFRDRHGPFKTVDDLLLVKGIGEATLERNRDRLTAASR
ncbi:MAG: ComEA family DNA-binding protein [Gammaproteobacteria bacterium]